MRRTRWLTTTTDPVKNPSLYHCIARVVDRRFVFGDTEREQFRIYLRMYEKFTGCRLLSYCIMSNHFHILLEVPPFPEAGLTDEELLTRLRAIYTDGIVGEVVKELKEAREKGLEARVAAIHYPAGNRTSVLDAGGTTNYTTNSVNAYTNISGGGILPPSQNPDYDPNGNMLSGPVGTDAAVLSYDNEHARRLVGRAEFAEQSPVRGDFSMLGKNHQNRLRTITQNGTTTGYTYDALSRCIETLMNNPRTARSPCGHVTKVPVQNAYMPSAFFNNTSPTDNRERYTWSGWTLLNRELFTGTTPTSSFRYTWGLDLSETLEGAGGVGGLLAI